MKVNENTKITLTLKQLRRLVKEAREPFGDFDYPEWIDDIEYHKGQKPNVAQVLRDLGWSVAVDDEKLKATPPSWGTDITLREGDKIMKIVGDVYSMCKRCGAKADAYYVGQAFDEIKSALEMTMYSPLTERRLVREHFTEEDFYQVDRMVDHAIENREQWEGGDVYGWLEDNYPDVDMRLITFATEIITDRLGLNESETGKVKEAKKVKPPRYTIQQYCDMKGLDADKLTAAMKAHWSILSPPLTDRTTFPEHALDTYAERYADEMNADTPIEVQADDEAEVDVDEPYRDCGVMVHSVKGDREYGFRHFKDIGWFDSKEDMQHWLKCGCEETDGSEQDRFYSMLHQLEHGIKVVDYNEV